jgi:putative membrane protein
MAAALFAFAHHLGAFSIFAALVLELVLLRGEATLASARKLLLVDRAYGIAAAAIVVIGFVRVAWFEKTPAYYLHSAPFIAKVTLFAAIGLTSIYPTMQMLSWRHALAADRLPDVEPALRRRLALFIHIELTLLAALILCAALMAKGVAEFT